MALFSKGKEVFHCPISGEVAPLAKSPDIPFSKGMLGDGIVIFPSDNKVYAPCDARVNFTFPTRHAIGLETASGKEFLIHVGINTNTLQGEGFHVFVHPKERVRKGQLLMQFDEDIVKQQELSLATPVVFTNVNQEDIEVLKVGYVEAKEVLMIVKG